MKRNPIAKMELILMSGLFFVLSGIVLLLVTTQLLDFQSVLLPFIFIIFGFSACYVILSNRHRPRYLFISTYTIFFGIFLILLNIKNIDISLSNFWPFLSFSAGLSFLIVGFKKYRRIRAVFFIPSLFFILLSIILFLFSFKIITLTIRDFFLFYWPMFFIIVGLLLLVLYILNRLNMLKKFNGE